MQKTIRKTIKTYARTALVATRDEEPRILEVNVVALEKPRNDKRWDFIARESAKRKGVDFIKFKSEPYEVRKSYEMELTKFISKATLIETDKED